MEADRQYVLEQAANLARRGEITASLTTISRAIQLDPTSIIDGYTWNEICWNGALFNMAAQVLDACEEAVRAAPDDGIILRTASN